MLQNTLQYVALGWSKQIIPGETLKFCKDFLLELRLADFVQRQQKSAAKLVNLSHIFLQ